MIFWLVWLMCMHECLQLAYTGVQSKMVHYKFLYCSHHLHGHNRTICVQVILYCLKSKEMGALLLLCCHCLAVLILSFCLAFLTFLHKCAKQNNYTKLYKRMHTKVANSVVLWPLSNKLNCSRMTPSQPLLKQAEVEHHYSVLHGHNLPLPTLLVPVVLIIITLNFKCNHNILYLILDIFLYPMLLNLTCITHNLYHTPTAKPLVQEGRKCLSMVCLSVYIHHV